MKEFNDYQEAKEVLLNYFNFNGLVEDIEDYRAFRWRVVDDILEWWEGPDEDMEEPEYSEYIDGVYKGKEYTMILIYSSFNDKRLSIFDNSKEIK